MKVRLLSVLALGVAILFTTATLGRSARPQTGSFTLAGEWIVKSQPINGQTVSRRGNTLGFPDRDMVFTQEGDLRTGMVLREDIGPEVRPLGVWRVEGPNLSSAFELWCPDPSTPCGSVIMRGSFSDPNTISGTMSVFFEVEDDATPTGLDTWAFSFNGTRK
jgi:hypothetical protein